jgi:4'-phosphopantetheinyl transferase
MTAVVRIDWLRDENAPEHVLAESLAWLDPAERERHARFAHAQAARGFVLGRWLMRRSLAEWSGVAPVDWRFRLDRHGRPVPHAAGVAEALAPRANLTHGGGLVACVSARGLDVGIDVEATSRDVPLGVAERFFARAELAELQRLEGAAWRERFWRLWTLKEAWLKGRGTGIAGSLSSFEVRFAPDGAAQLRGPRDAGDWRLFERQPTDDHRLAVAVRVGADRTVALTAVESCVDPARTQPGRGGVR